MLSTQKPLFKQDIKSCVEDAMYEALYKAMMATYDLVKKSQDSNISNEEMAKAFAKAGRDAFSDKLVNKLVDAVDTYVKAIGISVNCPVPSTTVLASPVGPVTGTISILPSNINIL